MALKHGNTAVFKVGATNLSTFTNSIDFKLAADSHDVTTFGATGHKYQGGLTDGTISLAGFYDDAASATPKVTFAGAAGTTVTWTYQPEGLGDGLAQYTGSAVITSYSESTPVADMITWAAELQISGAVVADDQEA